MSRITPPIYASWAILFFALTPHLAAVGVSIGKALGGPSVFAAEKPVYGLGLDDLAGGEFLWLFPALVGVGWVLMLLTLPLKAIATKTYWAWLPPRKFVRPMLIVFGWGPFGLCLWFALSNGGEGLVSAIIRSPCFFLECVEGRGVVGLLAGLVLGLVLTAVGVWVDARRRQARRLAHNDEEGA